MMSIRSVRGLTGPLYFWSGLHREHWLPQLPPAYDRQYRTSLNDIHNDRTSLNGIHNIRTSLYGIHNVRASQYGMLNARTSSHGMLNVRTSLFGHLSSFSRAALDGRLLPNDSISKLKSKFSTSRIHCTTSGDTVENVPNNKIPISLVTHILQIESGVKPKKPEPKTRAAAAKVESTNKSKPSPTKALKVRHSEPAISWTPRVDLDSKAVVPYVSSTALKNVREESTSTRPKMEDVQSNSDFKETYERLRRLGLLKARMSNCHLSMTSPSGATKFLSENGKAAVSQAAKKSKPSPKKPTEIKSKFLQNNVVLKVQHFYSSQGKDMPDELKSLSRAKANRYPTSSNSFADLKRRRYQVYPCTSPSSSYFARTLKKSE